MSFIRSLHYSIAGSVSSGIALPGDVWYTVSINPQTAELVLIVHSLGWKNFRRLRVVRW